jgi:hypothetical protein
MFHVSELYVTVRYAVPFVENLRALPLLYGIRNRLSDDSTLSPGFDDPLILQSHDLVIVIGNCSLSSNSLGARGAQQRSSRRRDNINRNAPDL